MAGLAPVIPWFILVLLGVIGTMLLVDGLTLVA